MKLKDIEAHWEDWAGRGTSVLATTKTATIKSLEIEAIARCFERMAVSPHGRILEAGCGNGHNCLALAGRFPAQRFTGFDYIQKMVDSAMEGARATGLSERCHFLRGDLRSFGDAEPFDAIFTVRAIINLNASELQQEAVLNLARSLRPGGILILLENDARTHARQNRLREALGLPGRQPAEFNLFLDGAALTAALARQGLSLAYEDDFACLHDLLLYVLDPAAKGGTIDYGSPHVQAVTQLLLSGALPETKLGIGQNRLIAFRKAT